VSWPHVLRKGWSCHTSVNLWVNGTIKVPRQAEPEFGDAPIFLSMNQVFTFSIATSKSHADFKFASFLFRDEILLNC